MKRWNVFLLCLTIFLSGCTGSSATVEETGKVATTTSTVVVEPEAIPKVKLTKNVLPSPSASFVPPTTTQQPSETPTLGSSINLSCLDVQDESIKTGDFRGTLLFLNPRNNHILSLMNIQSKSITEIQPDGSDPVVSPDRKHFASESLPSGGKVELQIFSSDGTLLKALPRNENWDRMDRWLDDEHLIIVLADPIAPEISERKYPDAVAIYNPFTNQIKTLPPEYPDIDTVWFNNVAPWYPSATTIYHSDLSRVIYPSPTKGIVLYSIPEKKVITQVKAFQWLRLPPVWSPDGTKFILMGDDEFYLVSYDGVVKRLTYLNPNVSQDKMALSYLAQYYTWSPDNRHVAFWLKPANDNRVTLAILDTQTGDVTDYCVKAGFNPEDFQYYQHGPVWSPDGKGIAVAANYHDDSIEGGRNDVLLIDLENNTAYKIASNIIPVGWLASISGD